MRLCPRLKDDDNEGSGEDVELYDDVDGGGDTLLRRFTVPNDNDAAKKKKSKPPFR